MIKSNSDHVLLVDSAASSTAVKQLATMVMANSSGNLILSSCKRNSLCTCTENENHSLNLIKSFGEEFEKSNCTEHQTGDTKKCKLNVSSDYQQNSSSRDQNRDHSNMRSNNQPNHQNNNQSNNSNDNEINNHQQNNEDQNNNENNDENLNLNQFQMANQLVDINNNIIEPELMLVDENNNLIGLPDANFDLNNNNNYLWNNNNVVDNLEQRPQDNQQQQENDQPQNQQQSNHQNNERTSHQMNNLVKDGLLKDHMKCKSNCTNSKSNCTNCKSTNHLQSVQLRQRKKLLELDLNRSSGHQFYSTMNEEENVIKEEECNGTTTSHHYVLKRSNSSGRRKKSIHQCKKCLTKHLTKCDNKNENSKCEHYHSVECATPEALNETKKHNFKKASTPLTLCPVVTTPTIKEHSQLLTDSESELNQQATNKSNLLETATATNLTNTSLISPQCPICLFTLNEPCKPNNCTHSFCSICVIEWAKVSNECPLCRMPFTALLNKNGKALEKVQINLQTERDLLNFELSQSALENLINLDDLNWPFIASSFLNQTGQANNLIDQQQCEQINSILNSVFGHLESESMMDLQWPF